MNSLDSMSDPDMNISRSQDLLNSLMTQFWLKCVNYYFSYNPIDRNNKMKVYRQIEMTI